MTDAVITIKGSTYPLESLPKEIQDLVSVYKRWEVELSNTKVEVFKLEAALKRVGQEIEIRVESIVGAKKSEE